jgi:hypothetical protein
LGATPSKSGTGAFRLLNFEAKWNVFTQNGACLIFFRFYDVVMRYALGPVSSRGVANLNQGFPPPTATGTPKTKRDTVR